MLLSIAIISYILSLVIALLFVFTAKKLHPGWFRMLAGIHLVLLVFFLFTFFAYDNESRPRLAFLFFFCSGIIIGGLAFGMNKAIPFKIYFGLFDASVLLFLLSPSTLLNFLITAKLGQSDDLIRVKEKYFLEIQNTFSTGSENTIQYKLIRKTGMFHKTISRNINFNGKLDSVKVLDFQNEMAAEIRGYTSTKTFVTDEVDSTDVTINLNPTNKDVIQRRL
jgi:hypothetical protein